MKNFAPRPRFPAATPPSNRQPTGIVPPMTKESRSQPIIRSEEIAPEIRIDASGAMAARRSTATLADPLVSVAFWAAEGCARQTEQRTTVATTSVWRVDEVG